MKTLRFLMCNFAPVTYSESEGLGHQHRRPLPIKSAKTITMRDPMFYIKNYYII